MRFAEPFTLKPNMTPQEKLEAERLMFLELTQSKSTNPVQGIEHRTDLTFKFASGVTPPISRSSSI